ncbi:MAG: haloacid dehalogenase-like hydrolase [Clostridiales bacterium]|nr:haloacid dehalogenase-like hydrolase [Clostridiales bacterium]
MIKNNRVALLYDFDCTLSDGFMQENKLAKDLGFSSAIEFFLACDARFQDGDLDMCLGHLLGTIEFAKEKGIDITKEYLQSCGKNITFYKGVTEWFDKINAVGKKLGLEVEHYVISSGVREIIEGSAIADKFKRIYGCFYLYRDGKAIWPSQVANYTTKTQYIHRVRKGAIDNLASLIEVNKKMTEDEMLPFKNMIYLGDSQTDIPSFKTVKVGGGLSICVYDEKNEHTREVAQECFIEGRVNYFAPADYSENRELFQLIKNYLENIAGKEIEDTVE